MLTRNPLLDRVLDVPVGRRRIIRHPPEQVPAHGPRPTVTAIVPCYNYGRFLDDCVTSLVTQDGVDVDVVIIDDCSTDDSADIAGALADRYPQVSALVHERNLGHLATYNQGLDLAGGEFTVLIDADDLLAPGALGRATALMRAELRVGMVYGHPRTFTGSPPQRPSEPTRSWSVWSGADWIAAQCRRGLSILYSPEVVLRTAVRREVGGFRAELPHAGDVDLWLRFAAVADVGRVNGPDQAYRRMHPDSMMQSGYGTVLLDLRGRLEALESFFRRDAGTLAQRDELWQLTLRRTAQEALGWVNQQLSRPPEQRADDAEIAAYLNFARQTCPQLDELPEWREYRARVEHPETSRHRVRAAVGARRRDLAGRYTFQRWYWNGY